MTEQERAATFRPTLELNDRETHSIGRAAADIITEVTNAMEKFPAFNSMHEGYAVLLEEVDELWEMVKLNQKKRDDAFHAEARKECIQIAAMAVRILNDCLTPGAPGYGK